MKKITTYQIALSALACALATIFLTLGVVSEVLLFTGYLLSGIALMLPLAKQSYLGYVLAFLSTCILSCIFASFRFWDILPFLMFFGLHPLANELQLKWKINRYVACAVKALWFDLTMYLVWKVVFAITTSIPAIDTYILPIILLFGTIFFIGYDYLTFGWRNVVMRLVRRISK
ncbi:MAG: hypothetical protein IJ996_05915 [Clostridia bacterium]|nr:hypothetical protein [Clostridia bacterium]